MNITKFITLKRIVVSGLVVVSFIAVMFALSTARPLKVAAAGECSAAGYYPKMTGMITNGSFAITPTDIAPAGSAGTDAVTPGHDYANASFRSQMANAGHNIYPNDDLSNGQGTDLRNVFSTQVGAFDGTVKIPGDPNAGSLNQLPFPGDPTYGVPGVNTWLYTNGNALDGTEYLTWEQDVTGLTIGTEYVFVAYISNVIEPPNDSPDDPTIRLRTGGTAGLPDGTVIGGPTVLTEAATANSQPLNGWQRVAFAFTATATSEKLKITDASTGWWGDDFAMTAIHLSECTPTPDYAVSLSHSGTPSQHGSYTQRVTLTNAGTIVPEDGYTTTITLPTGYTVNGGSAGAVTLTNNTGNYTCTANAASPQVITCTSPDPIPLSGSRQMEFTVGIGPTASASSTITAVVAQPMDENAANDTATDIIPLEPDLHNQLTVETHTETTVTLKNTVENIGTYRTPGNDEIEFTLPDGISINDGGSGSVAIHGRDAADWTCTSDDASPQKVTCVRVPHMRNLSDDNQEFLITLNIDPSSTKTRFDFSSTSTAVGDNNPSNDTDTTSFMRILKTPDPVKDEESLATTGMVTTTGLIIAGSLIVTGSALLIRKRLF